MSNTKKLLFVITQLIVLACILFAGCEKQGKEDAQESWLDTTFSEMTDTQKIGQILCLSVDPIRYYISVEYKENINTLMKKYKPGAVYLSTVLDDWKFETRNEFNGEKLLAEIINLNEHSGIPLLIGADFETGAWYWDRTATRFSFPLALGATQSTDLAYRQGKITAVEAKAQGINWIFTPVVNTCDYLSDQFKIRSFGNDQKTVGDFGRNFVKGYQETGLAACLKYFPVDKLVSLPDNSEYTGLLSFKVGIEAGVLSVMCCPLDSETLTIVQSQNTIKEVLRNKLGFNGLIAGSLTGNGNEPLTSQEYMSTLFTGLKAGYNIIILPETFETAIPTIDLMFAKAEEHNLDMALIDEAIRKVLDLKDHMKLQNYNSISPYGGTAGIGLAEYQTTARNISDASVTLIKNDGGVLPFDYENQHIVSIILMDDFSVFEGTVFYRKLTQVYENIKNLNIIGIPDIRMKNEIMRRVSEADVVLYSFFIKPDDTQSRLSDETQDFIKQVMKKNSNVAAVSFYSPYLINIFPELKGYMATYSPTEHSMNTVIEIIFGKRNPVGKLPVTLSNKYPAGLGLQYE